jgi:hypothetical protein
MVYGLYRALPGDRALLPPSFADISATLTPASGRQDHTTSPSASCSPVKRAAASTASRSASVTLRNAPLRSGTVRTLRLIWASEKAKYFLRGGWTDFCARDVICPSGSHIALQRGVARSRHIVIARSTCDEAQHTSVVIARQPVRPSAGRMTGSGGRSSIPQTVMISGEAAEYWIPRMRGV